MKTMDVTVIVCTYNRCESLRETLDSLRTLEVCNHLMHEIIVVDNNSKDKTKEVVCSYMPKFDGRLKYIFEQKQGLSYARNRGIKESKGQIIVFTDDDVIVDKNYLLNMVLIFNNTNAGCVGGKIFPIWQGNKPFWLSRKLYGKLALLDYGNKSIEIKSEKYKLFGANVAFKKYCFKEYGLFNTNLGRKGKRLFVGEDTAYIDFLLKNKVRIMYHPSIIVYHKVSRERLKKSYFRKWDFDAGVSLALDNLNNKREKVIVGIPRYRIREFFRVCFKYIVWLVKNNNKEVFFVECKIIFYLSFFLTKIKLKLGVKDGNY